MLFAIGQEQPTRVIALPGDCGRPLKDTYLRRGGHLREAERIDAARSQPKRAVGTLLSKVCRELDLLVLGAFLHVAALHLPCKPLGKRGKAAGRAIADICWIISA